MKKIVTIFIIRNLLENSLNIKRSIDILKSETDFVFLVFNSPGLFDWLSGVGEVRLCGAESGAAALLHQLLQDSSVIDQRDVFLIEDHVVINNTLLTALCSVLESEPMVQVVKPVFNSDRFVNFFCDDVNGFYEFFESNRPINSTVLFLDYQGCCLISRYALSNRFDCLFVEYGLNSYLEGFFSQLNLKGYVCVMTTGALAFVPSLLFRQDVATDPINVVFPDFLSRYADTFHNLEIYYYLNYIIRDLKKKRLGLDLTLLSADGLINGTVVATKKISQAILKQSDEQGWSVFVIAYPDVVKAHALDTFFPSHVEFVRPEDIPHVFFDVLLRTAQPNSFEEVRRLSLIAKNTIFIIQDIISMDCLHYKAYLELKRAYAALSVYSDALVFISDFSRLVFSSRFKDFCPKNIIKTIHHSLSIDDYRFDAKEGSCLLPELEGKEFIFVVGNQLSHKCVIECSQELLKVGDFLIVSLGGQSSGRCFALKAGSTDEAVIRGVYLNSDAIVYPSSYEGFGFPVLEALANKKTVFVRDNFLNRELKRLMNNTGSIKLFLDYEDLLSQLMLFLQGDRGFSEGHDSDRNWNSVGSEYLDLISSVYAINDFEKFRDKISFFGMVSRS